MLSFTASNVKRPAQITLIAIAFLAQAGTALAQNAQSFMNMFGGMMAAAMVQQARQQWAAMPASEASCFQAGLAQHNVSVDRLIRAGITPTDPRLASIRAVCEQFKTHQLRHNVECPIETQKGEYQSWCDEAYVRTDQQGNHIKVSLGEVAASAFSGEGITTELLERPDAQSRRLQMMAAGAPAGRVPVPNFNCNKAHTSTELAICGSYELSELDSDYGRLFDEANAIDHRGSVRREARVLYRRSTACEGEQDCIKQTSVAGIDFMANFLRKRGQHVTTFLDRQREEAHQKAAAAQAQKVAQETAQKVEEDKRARLEKAANVAKSLIDDASAFLKFDPTNPNTLTVAEAIAAANAAIGTADPEQIEKTSSALSQALHNDSRFAAFVQKSAEQRADEISRHLHDAIKLARQQRSFMTRYIAENPTSATAAAFISKVKELDGEIASPILDQLRATTDDVNALLIKNNLRNQFFASSAADLQVASAQGTPNLSLATTEKNRFLMTGDLQDVVFMFNSSPKAPHVARNLRGDVIFDKSTASVCFFQKTFDAALVQRARTTLARYDLKTVSFHQACGSDTLLANDIIVVRRGDFLRQSPSYASALAKKIELGDFKQLTTFTQKMAEAEDQSSKARRQQLEADIESGASDGFGVIFLVKNTSQTICAAVSSQIRGHQALLLNAISKLANRMGARPSVEITPIETAFDLSQHNKCGMIYASATDLRKLLSALKKQAIDYSVEDIWFKSDEVAKAESNAETTQSQADEQEADRVRKADDKRKLAAQRAADLAATKSARQAALRLEYGKIAASSSAAISDDVKRFVDGGGNDEKVAQTYPNFAAWYQDLLKDHWELMTMNSNVADYGTIVWKGRKLVAGITAISFRLRNRTLGEYKSACFEFGHVIDNEFHIFRDPYEGPARIGLR